MSARETGHYASTVLTVAPDASVEQVATVMADRTVGCVVVAEKGGRPLGILTDRDLLCRVVSRGLPGTTQAAEVMSKPLQTASPGDPLEHVLELMCRASVRRIPVVKDGCLVGIVSTDDLIVWFARELDDLSEGLRRELWGSRKVAHRRRRREEIEERLAEIREQVTKAGEQTWEFLGHEVESLRERIARALGRETDGKGPAGKAD